jgi:hypothetical protein
MGQMKNTNKILIEKSEGKEPLGGSTRRKKYIIIRNAY